MTAVITKNIHDLHWTLTGRLSVLANAIDGVFFAADACAAVAEEDPRLAGYLAALMPLLKLQVPVVPDAPTLED
jgi:hypothetical protein